MRTTSVRLAAAMLTAALVLNQAPSARAASVTVAAPTAKGAKGAEVSIPISVTAAPGVGALHVELTYDASVLEGLSVSSGKLASNALVDGNPTPGRLIMGLVSSDRIEGDGEVIVAKFRVLGEKGATTALGLENVQAWEATLDRLDIAVTAQPGQFTVTGKSAAFPWWIILAAAAVLLLLLAIALKRRNRDEAAAVAVGAPVAVVTHAAAPPPAPAPAPVRSGPPPFSPSGPPSLPPGHFRFSVDTAQRVVDSAGIEVATLTPGQTYIARRTEGEWTEVDADGGIVGWIPSDAARRTG